jgi:hypothetical protein
MHNNLNAKCIASSTAYETAMLEFGRKEVVTPCTVLDRYVAVIECVETHHAAVRAANLAIVEAQLCTEDASRMIAFETSQRVTTQSEAIRVVSDLYDTIVTGLDETVEEESEYLSCIKQAQKNRDIAYKHIHWTCSRYL